MRPNLKSGNVVLLPSHVEIIPSHVEISGLLSSSSLMPKVVGKVI